MTANFNPTEMTDLGDAVAERDAIVRFCTRYTRNADEAEDLAQQTLTQAWLHRGQLRDPAARQSWLLGIARNVCAAWARRRVQWARYGAEEIGDLLSPVADPGSAAESAEVADLFDRALRCLPDVTRQVLVQRYIEDVSQSDVAMALGISQSAVEARVHRGKATLRHLLTTQFRAEAVHLGIVGESDDQWHETRILCPFCGMARLCAQLNREQGAIAYRCPGECVPGGTIVGGTIVGGANMDGWRNLSNPKAILTRALTALHAHYDLSLRQGGRRCWGCGVRLEIERERHAEGHQAGIRMQCGHCGGSDSASLWHLALDTPAAQRFWRQHPRMRALPTVHMQCHDRPVIAGGFESAAGGQRLDILFDPDTYRIVSPAP